MTGEEIKTIEDMDSFSLNGYPFLYSGMTVEQFEEERTYFWQNWQDYKNDRYEPLWKQRGEEHEKYNPYG